MNAIKGEFTAIFAGKSYKCKTGTNQTAIFESVTGLTLKEYSESFDNPDRFTLTNIRALIYSCLIAAKNEITLEEVGDLMDEMGKNDLSNFIEGIGKTQDLTTTKKK